MSSEPGPVKRSAVGVLFLTVFIDLLGFGIVLPLLPRYARDFDANGLELGLLMASFSAMQLLFAPLWGRLSDRRGRRPMIMLGLGGSTASYVLFAVADTYALLLVSRLLAGLFAATIGTAQAYIADVTGRDDRGKEMALIGAAFGIGFTLGPVLGWLAHEFGGVRGPGFVAAGFSLVALLMAWKKLPEPARHRPARAGRWFLNPEGLRIALRTPGVPLVLGLQFLAVFCFSNFESTLALLTKEKWGYDIQGNGLLYTYVGFCLLVAQGAVVRRLMPRVGEKAFAWLGCALLGAGLLGIAAGGGALGWILAVLAVATFGFSMISPSLSSLLSLHSPGDRQGEILGLGQSVLSLARILGPFVGYALFDRSPETPYWTCAAIMAVAVAGALLLRAPPADS